MLSDAERQFAARLTAHQFLIEILLANLFNQDRSNAGMLISEILRVGAKVETKRAQDDVEAEAMADIAVQSQQQIERIVERARERAKV